MYLLKVSTVFLFYSECACNTIHFTKGGWKSSRILEKLPFLFLRLDTYDYPTSSSSSDYRYYRCNCFNRCYPSSLIHILITILIIIILIMPYIIIILISFVFNTTCSSLLFHASLSPVPSELPAACNMSGNEYWKTRGDGGVHLE